MSVNAEQLNTGEASQGEVQHEATLFAEPDFSYWKFYRD